jgi:hypothetical protein
MFAVFDDALSTTPLNGRIAVNDNYELGRFWKEAVVVCYNVVFQLRITTKNLNQNDIFKPGIEPMMSRIRGFNAV